MSEFGLEIPLGPVGGGTPAPAPTPIVVAPPPGGMQISTLVGGGGSVTFAPTTGAFRFFGSQTPVQPASLSQFLAARFGARPQVFQTFPQRPLPRGFPFGRSRAVWDPNAFIRWASR